MTNTSSVDVESSSDSEYDDQEQSGRSFNWQIINGLNGTVINTQILVFRSLCHYKPHPSMKGLINSYKVSIACGQYVKKRTAHSALITSWSYIR